MFISFCTRWPSDISSFVVFDIPSGNENISNFGMVCFGSLSCCPNGIWDGPSFNNFLLNKAWNCLSLHGEGTCFKTTNESNGEITSPHSQVRFKVWHLIDSYVMKFPNSKQTLRIYSELPKMPVKCEIHGNYVMSYSEMESCIVSVSLNNFMGDIWNIWTVH